MEEGVNVFEETSYRASDHDTLYNEAIVCVCTNCIICLCHCGNIKEENAAVHFVRVLM